MSISGTNSEWSRAMLSASEPFILAMLFSREIRDVVAESGITPATMFIAVRGAPLGRACTAVVTAAFHAMPAEVVVESWSQAWLNTSPERVLEAQHDCLPRTAGRTGLPDVVDHKILQGLADELTDVVAGLDTSGRVLAAANQSVAAPDEVWARFWRAANTLREYRGDAHIAALVAADLDVAEALALTIGWGSEHVDAEMLRASRRLTDARWDRAIASLSDRGFFTASGQLTASGREVREGIEATTDRAAARPWATLGFERCEQLYGVLSALSTALIEAHHMRARTAVGAPWPPLPLTRNPTLGPDRAVITATG
jgi:hypothetical protein